jgi:hypothetical protein
MLAFSAWPVKERPPGGASLAQRDTAPALGDGRYGGALRTAASCEAAELGFRCLLCGTA